jgi:protease I
MHFISHAVPQVFSASQVRAMTATKLDGFRVAILVTDGFEQAELEKPQKALEKAGATTKIISPNGTKVRGWESSDWGSKIPVDVALDDAQAVDFDGLLLPGGVINPDKLRMLPKAVAFVKAFFDQSKPVAAICHGPIMLIEAGVVQGRRLTSWPSIRTDLQNAGADWVYEEAVVDRNLLTSRKPDDIPAFNTKMIAMFSDSIAIAGKL